MFFQKLKECNDYRVIKAGISVVEDFKHVGIKIKGFACCFKGNTFIYAFYYDTDVLYSENIQTAVAHQFIKMLPNDKKYKKIVRYSSEDFDTKCSKDLIHYYPDDPRLYKEGR